MRRLVEAATPARLGSNFRWLLWSSWSTNLADGLALAAGPLLVASVTDSAFIVGLSWLLARLPWLLFGLHAGVVADRRDRRQLLIVANLARVAIVAALAVAVTTDRAGVGLVLAVLFIIGTAEVVADTTSTTLLPMVIEPRDLTTGNTRLLFGQVGLNQLIGPSVGAALFVAAAGAPYMAQAVALAIGVILVGRLRLPASTPAGADPTAPTGARSEIADGLRWLWANAPMRTLALTILIFNVTFGAAFSVLVVLSMERLGLDDFGFGLLTSVTAAGAIVGTIAYGATERRIGATAILRVGLIIETLTHLVLAVATTAWPAMVTMFVFGIHASMWGTTSTSVRQATVPNHLQGRVASAYLVGMQGGLVVGAALGAILAGTLGITAPYWFAFVGSAIVLALIWRQFAHLGGALDQQ